MKKTFLMFGVVASIYATNVFAAQTSTIGTKPVQAEDGYNVVYTCPRGCTLETVPVYTTDSRMFVERVYCIHSGHPVHDKGHGAGDDCGEPTVVNMDYSIKSQQVAEAAKNIELSKDVGFKGALEVPASKLDRQPEKSHIKPRSAVRVPTKIIYKEIILDDDIEEIEDFGM